MTMSVSFMHGEYYCEVCDQSWMTPEELEKHLSEHISCHVEGCTFNAAPKIVALHIKLQHETGVFDKIVQGYNSEDIEKWKAERRRNYPTLANLEKKLAQKREMEDRGERLVEKSGAFVQENGFTNKNDNYQMKKKQRKRKRKNRDGPKKQQFLSTASLSEEAIKCDTVEVSTEVEHFSDEEWLRDEAGKKQEPAPLSKALLALSTSYASDSEDENSPVNDEHLIPPVSSLEKNNEDEAPVEEKISRESDNLPNVHVDKVNKMIDSSSNQSRKKVNPKPLKAKVAKTEWKPSLRKRPLTLLEKLLSKEIRQERNYILQCIRYIVQENYFQDKC